MKYLHCPAAMIGLLAFSCCATALLGAQRRKAKPLDKVRDDPKLPRVLLIGDSISIGYTIPVRAALKGVANVHRPSENCAGTKRGLERIDKWLGDGKWDVIHFNWGLHDLKYQDKKGRLTTPEKGMQQTPVAQYEKNLETLVRRLEQTGAKLIFATTTPIPRGSAGRVVGDEDKYNAAARRVMKRHGIAINDLGAFARTLPEDCKRKANVHFTRSGYEQLGKQVADAIRRALEKSVAGLE